MSKTKTEKRRTLRLGFHGDINARLHTVQNLVGATAPEVICPGYVVSNIFEMLPDPNGGAAKVKTNVGQGIYWCSDPSHEGQVFDRCRLCGEQGIELDDLLACKDVDGCEERRAQARERHPLIQELKACHEAGEAMRQEKNEERAAKREVATPRRVAEADPLGGRCNHCGEPTKGGRFVAGHDAKLKGELMRAAIGDVPDSGAILEMLCRGWLKRPQLVESGKLALAEATFQGMNEEQGIAFLQTRNKGRWTS